MKWTRLAGAAGAALGAVTAYDLTQRSHALLRNFPVIGHGRYLLEKVGPELRQYIVTSNQEERPFSRDQRAWIYTSAKGLDSSFGFGTDIDVEHTQGLSFIKHRTFADGPPARADEAASLPSAKVLGGPRARAKAFRPASAVNISGMSFGALSDAAASALNRAAAAAGCLHNTGEGGLAACHRNGGELVFQVGSGYFGCRAADGSFDLGALKELVASAPVRAIEIKLSQGAKPGLGGRLPAAKVTAQIAQIRGVPMGQDCESPGRHTAFGDVDSMLDFVELLAAETGLPVGIKSAVGELGFWQELAQAMAGGDRGVDFITVDGGEGGTGAAPLLFADAVSLPFRLGFSRVYGAFAELELTDQLTFIGSGKLGLPQNAAVAFALGADMVNVGREALLSIGCIQSQRCHTGKCPVGVATQDPRLARGIDVPDKTRRAASYLIALRRELIRVAGAVGIAHPALLTPRDIEISMADYASRTLGEIYGYREGWGELGHELTGELLATLAGSTTTRGHGRTRSA
ncbi:MAG: FMN-binding glutamate synthase family protein [Frankiaceae bacterium]|jgi:glutamate synthase domain-containing protein 2|nr:FMN-binding glutamate synthase family protein [Frankiaceae bacterium]